MMMVELEMMVEPEMMMVEFKMMMVELETIMMWNCHSGLVTFPALAKSAVLKRTHCYTDCHTDSNAQPRCFLAAVLCVLRCEFNSEYTGVIAFWQKIFTLCTLAFEVFRVEQTGKGREG